MHIIIKYSWNRANMTKTVKDFTQRTIAALLETDEELLKTTAYKERR